MNCFSGARLLVRCALIQAVFTGIGWAQQHQPPPSPPTAQSEAGEPRAHADAPAAPRAAPRPKAAKAAADRLDLNTATVTGDREQPKVMYIVPWKRSDIGELSGKPMNSLLDEVLAPVDRDVFKRVVTYYDAVNTPPSPQGEK
ncbi:MAG: hypothetical protein M3O06_04270 [Pseudomonadota bacterium]|nr:hypothetical protein [Pseudomonadota bacterium]